MKINIAAPRGTQDILPEDVIYWHLIEQKATEIFNIYGFKELRTPIFEVTSLFSRGIGQNTDIVEKEMYTFEDRKGRSLTLRPEATASVVRAYLEHSMHNTNEVSKLWYQGPMFRYERPQAGRFRQFYQIGCEVLKATSAFNDAELIGLSVQLFENLGLKDLEVHLNSVGCKLCRKVIKERLKSFLGDNLSNLCDNCQKRFDTNPLRILDCKNKKCNDYFIGLPDMTDVLCAECKDHFHDVQNYLDIMRIKYKVNPRLVRGLDYYTKTVFEIVSNHLGAQNAVSGGGRYDNLVKELGGPDEPAVGFAFGMERLVMVMKNQKIKINRGNPFVTILSIGEAPKNRAVILTNKLRKKGIPVDIDISDRQIKSKLATANKKNIEWVLILGEDELVKKKGQLKNMSSGKQTKVDFNKFIKDIEKKYNLSKTKNK